MKTMCDDNSLPANSAIKKWVDTIVKASTDAGHPMVAASYKSLLEAAGFVNVVDVKYKWPQNRWPKDPKLKEIGMCNSLFGSGVILRIKLAYPYN